MSFTEDAPDVQQDLAGGSLADRVAQRDQELSAQPKHTIRIPIPGFEDLLEAEYRALGYREMWKLEKRHERNPDDAEGLLFVAADKLINACERIVEKLPDGSYGDTGYKWDTRTARELFHRELPDGAGARQALIAIFRSDEEQVVIHAAAYEEQRKALRPRVEEKLAGE